MKDKLALIILVLILATLAITPVVVSTRAIESAQQQ
jgi:hypothetical protein